MNKTLRPGPVNRVINAPASKSMMQRVVALGLLSSGKTTILNPSFAHDSLSALRIAQAMGASTQFTFDKISIERTDEVTETDINCGESGLAVRMFSPIISLFNKDFIITGEGSLKERPVVAIEEALTKLGVPCKTTKGYLPLTISGILQNGNIEIDGTPGSQTLTGLLIALPMTKGDSEIKAKNLTSKPYIDLTLKVIKDFGVEIINENYELFKIPGNKKYIPQDYRIEGDWSSTSFLLTAGLIGGKVEVKHLDINSTQADIRILDVIKMAGGKIQINKHSVITEKSDLTAFEFDATDCPDLFPPLVTLAAYSKGTSIIKGVSRLKYKESDRANALKEEFSKIGISIEIEEDIMKVHGGQVTGGVTDPHNDHRIAMACAVASIGATDEITINNVECVNKSYPNFFFDLFRVSIAPHRIKKNRR